MKHRLFFTAVLGLSLSSTAFSQVESTEDLQAEARQLVAAFVGELKPTLKQAMDSGGPTHAISICAEQAPAIAESLSASSGWRVTRVSLQPRNQQTAAPDAWEMEQLSLLSERREAGEEPSSLNVAAEVDHEFRYLQAQVVEPLCLACHGQSLSPDVKEALDRYYPKDTATGYQLGDVRGAISLSKEL